MSDNEKIEAAKQYVDKQLQTMKQYGSEPQNLSKEEYDGLVKEIAETITT